MRDRQRTSLAEKQAEFTDWIRQPEKSSMPQNVSEERMQVYRDLLINNINSTLSSSFPVIKAILPPDKWLAFVNAFFANHFCKTPYYSEIAQEFIAFLKNIKDQKNKLIDEYPFILELAHYEWAELALMIAEDNNEEVSSYNKEIKFSDYNNKNIKLSSLCWAIAYQYPVHKICSDYMPLEIPENMTYLMVYRDNEYKIKFVEITPLTYYLLEILSDNEGITGKTLIYKVLELQGHGDKIDEWIEPGLIMIKSLIERGVILVL